MEVAWEIRFPIQSAIDSQIDFLNQEYSKEYPHIKKLEDRSWNFNLAKNESITRLEGIIWEFSNSEQKDIIIRVNNQKFSVITNAHKSFSDLEKIIAKALKILEQVFVDNTPTFKTNRLGLRYINACKFPNGDSSKFMEWYCSPFNETSFDISTNEYFDLAFAEIRNNSQLMTKYKKAKFKDLDGFILDFDCFVMSPINFTDLLKETKKLQQIIRSKFENSITKEYEKIEMRREN